MASFSSWSRAFIGVALAALPCCNGRVEVSGEGGATGSELCVPGEAQSCYSGPAGTEGVGPCQAGTRLCEPSGQGFGPCTGEVTPAVETCLTSWDDDCDEKTTCPGEPPWSRAFDAPAVPYGIATDETGAVVLAGELFGNADFGGGSLGPVEPDNGCAVFVAKLDPSGGYGWGRRFGGSDYCDGASGVALDSTGDMWMTGSFGASVDFGGGAVLADQLGNGDIFVVKLDGAGEHLWSKGFGGKGRDGGWTIAVGSDDDVVIGGSFEDAVDFGGGMLVSQGSEDGFVTKLDAFGNHLWSRAFGGANEDRATGIAVDATGNVFVIGSTEGGIYFGQGPEPVGRFVLKLDPAGALLWSHVFWATGAFEAYGIATDPQGEAVIVGQVTGSVDFGGGMLTSVAGDAWASDVFVAKLGADGAHLWSRLFGASGSDVGRGVAVSSKDDILLTGYSEAGDFGGGPLPNIGGDDAFVAALDSLGNPLWSRNFGGPNKDVGMRVAIDPSDNMLVTGLFIDEIDLGAGPENHPGQNLFLMKLAP
jgi:hypothetical protein